MMEKKTFKGLVSVGIPTYNRPDFLYRALELISSQTYSNLEIVVYDNASSDSRVKEVIEEFLSRDPRVKYYRQEENKGILFNTEAVLKKAQGEFFMWLSDDDWRSPEFIEILVAKLEENQNIDMAFCDYREVYEDGGYVLEYPVTHLKVFKPFESRFRLVRTIAYYWQNDAYGNRNIFYSVFRRVAVDSLDLKKISEDYKLLNMDSLVVFSLLQRSSVSISSEVMCTLTCGNKKYYSDQIDDGLNRKITVWRKFINFWIYHKKDRDLYIGNTDSFLEKVGICCLFLLKFAAQFAVLLWRKFFAGSRVVGSCASVSSEGGYGRAIVSEREDVSNDQKLMLPNVTLIAMATRNVEETLQALVHSCKGIKFGSVKLLAHYFPYELRVNPDVEFFRIKKMESIDEWSRRIIYRLGEYIETDFALLVHADGFVVNPSSWRDEFLEYDYIGAPWPMPNDDFSYRDINGNIVRVGNSVSLRSKRLLDLPLNLNLPWDSYKGFYHEDGFICVKNKHIYEANGIKFASLDVAKYFSHETMIPEVKGIKPFCFHKWSGANRYYPRF